MAPMEQPTPIPVLVVDDDPFMLELLRDVIESFGDFDVYTAKSAREGLAALAGANPRLLVCDLSMPDMDGIEFLSAVARDGYRGRVALLSGLDQDMLNAAQGLARAQGLDVAGAFAKPVGLAELRAVLYGLADTPSDAAQPAK